MRHNKINIRSLKFLASFAVGSTLWINATCGSIVVDSVRNGLFSYVSGSVTNSSFTSQLNDFVLNVFTSNLPMSSGDGMLF